MRPCQVHPHHLTVLVQAFLYGDVKVRPRHGPLIYHDTQKVMQQNGNYNIA